MVSAASDCELNLASQKVSIKLYTDMAIIATIEGQLIFKIKANMGSVLKSILLIIF